ncbi:MAG: GNAT family N-acetyltransferase [Tumebacillaceae bacterium]
MEREQTHKLRNKQTLIIRPAETSDVEAVVDYIRLVAGETDYLTVGASDIKTTPERQADIIEQHNTTGGLFIVGVVDGEIAGLLNFGRGRKARTAHVGDFGLTVREKYWSYGIGTKLLQYLIEWAQDSKEIRKINLRVRTDNAPAIAIYEKLGFKHEGLLTRDFLIDGKFYDCYLMGIEIDPENEK